MLLTVCQNTFHSMVELEEVDSLRVEVRECYAEITRTSEQIQSTVRENYLSKDDLTTIQQDFQTNSLTEFGFIPPSTATAGHRGVLGARRGTAP